MAQDPVEGSKVLRAVDLLAGLSKGKLDALSLGRPKTIDHAAALGRIIGKLSPLVSDLLENEFAAHLNSAGAWPPGSRWIKQDPGFPGLALCGGETVHAGIEIKTWFPFATEVTGRFREGQTRLATSETRLMVVVWLPEFLLHGGPVALGVWADKAINVARVRDSRYHRPPQYVVVEPEAGPARTRNLQQARSAGYFFRGSQTEFAKAKAEIESWSAKLAFTSPEYQGKLRELVRTHPYALDTNFAKIDRIEHKSLQDFKEDVLTMTLHGRTVGEWSDGIAAEAADVLEKITLLGSQDP